MLEQTAQIAAKFQRTGDQSLVEAAVGLGLARAGATHDATAALEAAIARAVREPLLFVDASDLVHCVAGAAVPDRERLWLAAFEVARVHRVDAAKRAVIEIVDTAAPADASLVARALPADRLPREVLDAARNRFAERVADDFDDGDLLPLDAIDDALTAQRRIQQAARWLARHNRLADARELAAAVGLV